MSLFELFESLFNIDSPATTAIDFVNMTPYEIGRNMLLPFVFVFIILWAVLERMRIFNKRVNVILSLGISILLATTPAYTVLAVYITQVSGSSMLVIFGVLLVGGTFMWALGRGKDIYYEQAAPEKKLMEFDKKIQKAYRKGRTETAHQLELEKKAWLTNWRERQG